VRTDDQRSVDGFAAPPIFSRQRSRVLGEEIVRMPLRTPHTPRNTQYEIEAAPPVEVISPKPTLDCAAILRVGGCSWVEGLYDFEVFDAGQGETDAVDVFELSSNSLDEFVWEGVQWAIRCVSLIVFAGAPGRDRGEYDHGGLRAWKSRRGFD
jgi:hypothetical protein